MPANTGLGLLLVGVAGALRARANARYPTKLLSLVAALVVLALGIGSLAEHAHTMDLHIDQLLARSSQPPVDPGRPAPLSALGLTFLASALLVFDLRFSARARPSEWLVLGAGLAGLTGLLGLVFGAELRYPATRAPLIGMALPTAVGLLVVSVGLLVERPAGGVMRVATSAGPGGRQLRRFVLPAMLLPVGLGLLVAFPLRTIGSDALAVVVAVLAAAMTVVGLLMLTVTAVSLDRTYQALEASRAGARALVEQAPDAVFIADIAGRYTDVNSAGCRMLGYERHELIGKSIADVILPDDIDRLSQAKGRLLEGDVQVGEWTLRRKDGSQVDCEISTKIFADGRWQALVRDISERKRLERELRAAEAEQKFLANFGSALMSTIDDRETDRGRRPTDRRRARGRLLGRDARGGRCAARPHRGASRSRQGRHLPRARDGEPRSFASPPRIRGARDQAARAGRRRHARVHRGDRPERESPASVDRARSAVLHGAAPAGARRHGRLAGLHQHDAGRSLHGARHSLRRGGGDAGRPGDREGAAVRGRPARHPDARRRAQRRRPRSAESAGDDPAPGRLAPPRQSGSGTRSGGGRPR